LVSYDNVIRSSNFEKIKGNVKAVTKISCHPCMEHDIFNDLTEIGKKDAKVYDLLGERDLEVEWPPDVPGCYVIQHLLEFRKRWSEKSGLYSTQTLLQEHKTTGFTECHARKPFQTFIQISLEDIQKMQERLGYENF